MMKCPQLSRQRGGAVGFGAWSVTDDVVGMAILRRAFYHKKLILAMFT